MKDQTASSASASTLAHYFFFLRCIYQWRGKSIDSIAHLAAHLQLSAVYARRLLLKCDPQPAPSPEMQIPCIGYRASNHSHLHSVLDKAESEMRTIPKHLCEIPSSLSHTTHEILPLPPQPRNLPSKQFFLRSRTSPATSEPRD